MNFFYKENIDLNNAVEKYFSNLSKFNNKNYKGVLSIVLLGSLSRGEGSYAESDGKVTLLSDIEFFTIYPEGFDKFSEFEEVIQEEAKKVFEPYVSPLFHVDNTYIKKSNLKNLDKKLLTFDAIHFGKCVMGEDVMDFFPKVTINNINLIDIKDILTHRIFSVLYYGFPMKEAGDIEGYRYSLAKNSLDIMTVILAKHKILKSGFILREKEIKKLPIKDEIKAYFTYCLNIKLGLENEKAYTIKEMEEIFISLIKMGRKGFNIPLSNIKANKKTIVRRELGKVKRMLKYKNAPSACHLSCLIKTFEKGKALTKKELKDNLVLHGYPTL